LHLVGCIHNYITNRSSVIKFTVILILHQGVPSGVFVGGFPTLTPSFHTSHSRPFICPTNSSCKSKLQVCNFLPSFHSHSRTNTSRPEPILWHTNMNRTVTVHKFLKRRFNRCVLPTAFKTALTSTHPGYTTSVPGARPLTPVTQTSVPGAKGGQKWLAVK
jgi:hypothetical protein